MSPRSGSERGLESDLLDLRLIDKLPGHEFEKMLALLLIAQGYRDIERTKDPGDFGADILATKADTRVAIQVKRSVNAVGIAAVQQSLGGMFYYGASRAMVISNAHFSDSAKELAAKAAVELVDRRTLKVWIAQAKLAPRPTRIHPRPYQQQAIERLAAIRTDGGSRALAVMASGLGKTYLAAFDVKAFQNGVGHPVRVLYLSHQSIILEQARNSFREVFGAGRSYGRFDGELHEPDKDFVFGTFQSVYQSLSNIDPTAFDYLAVDEAHHTAAPTRDQVVAYLRPKFTLGLTATPFRGDGKDIYTYYNDTLAISLPLERAIVETLLAPIDYRVISDKANPKAVASAIRSTGKTSAKTLFRPRPDKEIVNMVLEKSSAVSLSPKILVFCADLRQMQHFATLFPDSRTVSGDDTRDYQISTVEDFRKGKFSVLLSRDVLNEGIDVPDATCLVFLRNTVSPVVFYQQLGRGLRKVEGKDKVLVLDFVNNLDRFNFIYSFFSRLEAAGRARRPSSVGEEVPESSLSLDQTARDVIKALISKKEEKGYIVELSSVVASFNYRVSHRTLRHIVDTGRLIPDFVLKDPNGHERMYLERPTLERFLREAASARFLEGLLPEKVVARQLGATVTWLKHQEKIGNLEASWVHRRLDGRIELYFDVRDVEGFRLLQKK